MSDIDTIIQLVLHERQGRDRGWWEQMRSTFWPDSRVHLSWYSGTGLGFVDGSEAMSGSGDRSVHRLGAPVVHIEGDRALVEIATAVEFRVELNDVLVDLISYTRLNYRVERRSGRWGILAIEAVYERDTVVPAIPGATVAIDPAALAGFHPSSALIAYYLDSRGYTIGDDLLGDDRPAEVDAFYAGEFSWLQENAATAIQAA